jgi:hypothetical protein
MRDHLRRYRAIRDALIQGYPGQLTGPVARHLTTLAAMISGIVGSKSTPLPHSATKVPDGTQAESRGKRLARWVRNDKLTEEVYFVPYAQGLLAHRALQPLGLLIDGRVVGRGCVAVMMHVVDKGRALPLAWQVRQGQQGHFPEALHIALVKQGDKLLAVGASVVLLGDGACDGTTLQHTLQDAQWAYVVRTGSHSTVRWDGERFRCETVAAGLKPGTLVALRDVHVTEAAYGPVRLLCCWAKGDQEPLHLITNISSAEEACRLSTKRFRIETFFSDQKSRGFHLHTSHLAAPTRRARLLMAACLASSWIIDLGALCEQDGWISMIPRGDRCDLSLFQLGLRLLEHLLNEDHVIPVAFYVSIET